MNTSKTKIYVLSLLCLAFSFNARAEGEATEESRSPGSLYIEPYAFYKHSDTTAAYPSPFGSSEGSAHGYGVGARAGVHVYSILFAGLDGRGSMIQFKDGRTGYNAKGMAGNWGPFVGVQMPIVGLRVWAGYVFRGAIDPEQSGILDVAFGDGRGWRVGAGFRVLMVSVNLEYEDINYGRTTFQKVGPFAPGTTFDSVQLRDKAVTASVSFPIEL